LGPNGGPSGVSGTDDALKANHGASRVIAGAVRSGSGREKGR